MNPTKRLRTCPPAVNNSFFPQHKDLVFKFQTGRLSLNYSEVLNGVAMARSKSYDVSRQSTERWAYEAFCVDGKFLAVEVTLPKHNFQNCLARYRFILYDSADGEAVEKFRYALFSKDFPSRQIDDFVAIEMVKNETEKFKADVQLDIDGDVRYLYRDIPEIKRHVASQSEFVKGFENYFMSKEHSDVTFEVQNKQFYAHKVIVSSRSPVFEAMFLNDFTESKEHVVKIADVDAESFDLFLKYIYTDDISEIKVAASKLITVADKYGLHTLKTECEICLLESLDFDNCLEYLAIAELHRCGMLKMCAMDFVVTHMREFIKSNKWATFRDHYGGVVDEMLESLYVNGYM